MNGSTARRGGCCVQRLVRPSLQLIKAMNKKHNQRQPTCTDSLNQIAPPQLREDGISKIRVCNKLAVASKCPPASDR